MKHKLSCDEFEQIDSSRTFIKFYSLDSNSNWKDILGHEWYELAQNNDKRNTKEYRYEKYLEWYSRKFSKLGQALK